MLSNRPSTAANSQRRGLPEPHPTDKDPSMRAPRWGHPPRRLRCSVSAQKEKAAGGSPLPPPVCQSCLFSVETPVILRISFACNCRSASPSRGRSQKAQRDYCVSPEPGAGGGAGAASGVSAGGGPPGIGRWNCPPGPPMPGRCLPCPHPPRPSVPSPRMP